MTVDPAQRRGSRAVAVLVYTVLRVALFLAVWALFQFLTPIKGLWAVVAGILVSGAISLIVLDRQRNAVAIAAGGVLGRINARIEASARAEDEDADGALPPAAGAASGEGEQPAEDQPVGEQEDPGALEGGDEPGAGRPA